VKNLFGIVFCIAFILGVGNAFALDTHYENTQGYQNWGYKNTQGYDNTFSYSDFQKMIYNNKIPYKEFFESDPSLMKIQSVDRFGKSVQAVIPVNQDEQEIKQEGIK